MKWPTRHVSAIGNQKVIPVWNSRWCEFSHVNTLLFVYGQKSKKYTFFYLFSCFETVYYFLLLYKHQWNTKWAFARKLDIFTCENNMLYSHVKISPLLWLRNKSRLSHQKLLKWNGLVFHWCLYNKYNITWPISLLVMIALSRERFFNSLEEKSRISARPCNILYLTL